jgi:hypothetical protein
VTRQNEKRTANPVNDEIGVFPAFAFVSSRFESICVVGVFPSIRDAVDRAKFRSM